MDFSQKILFVPLIENGAEQKKMVGSFMAEDPSCYPQYGYIQMGEAFETLDRIQGVTSQPLGQKEAKRKPTRAEVIMLIHQAFGQ